MIDPAVLFSPPRDHADANTGAMIIARRRQLQRDRQFAGDKLGHRFRACVKGPESPCSASASEILHRDGRIVELSAQLGDHRRIALLARHGDERIAGQQLLQPDTIILTSNGVGMASSRRLPSVPAWSLLRTVISPASHRPDARAVRVWLKALRFCSGRKCAAQREVEVGNRHVGFAAASLPCRTAAGERLYRC